MTDLKQEIAKLERKDTSVRFQEIIKIAYKRNELINLLSGYDEYIYDTHGNLWLEPTNQGGPVSAVFDIVRLTVELNRIYQDLGGDNFKSVLVEILTQMLNGTPTQLYYAIGVYCQLAILESGGLGGTSNFADWIHDYSFARDFHPIVFNAVKLRKTELLNTKIEYIGLLNNLYEWCQTRSNLLIHFGFSSITEV